ncbi:MAG: bifunctional alpha/beta hydrolase/class I SAM-dependent methyltransferase [Phycisphaeraceae bacterium]
MSTHAGPVAEAETRDLVNPSEHTAVLWDGTEIFYRAWTPARPTGRAMILFHRGHEHSGRFVDVVRALGLEDVAVFAWDQRGHGRSPGERGHASSFAHVVRDIDSFIGHVCAAHHKRLEDVVVLGHSVGAVAVTTWVHDYAPPIRAMVLATPAFRVKLYVPLAIPGLRLLQRLRGRGKAFIKSYVKAKMLTHDPEQARAYDDDPLIARSIAVNILLDLFDTSRRIVADAGAIRTPTLLLAGGSDWVVHVSTQARFFARLGSPTKRMQIFDGMYHDILHEKDRHLVLDEVRRFVGDAFGQPRPDDPLLDADAAGYTCNEHQRLCRPLPLMSLRRCRFTVQRLAMRTLGRLSDGIRLGWETGFDSGRTLDYVYENQPRGRWLIGRAIDRAYLDSPGWRGIRQRRLHLQQLLRDAIRETMQRTSERPIRILDVAAGSGRYVLDVLGEFEQDAVSATLRDDQHANLEAGRRLAESRGLCQAMFEQGDAFDAASLAGVQPGPHIVIVSGLYELFPANEPVLRSLDAIARAVRPPGYLICTGQPWHPQLEMIARVLVNRNGQPWIMRRRTQAELDALLRAAGFEKQRMLIDADGIFTVSLAARRENA